MVTDLGDIQPDRSLDGADGSRQSVLDESDRVIEVTPSGYPPRQVDLGGAPMSLARETGVRWVWEPGSMAEWLICCGMT